jgi:hypothetical protein
MWADDARSYLAAQARVDALIAASILAEPPTPTAAAPHAVEPAEPGVKPSAVKQTAKTITIKRKRIVARDAKTEHIAEVVEWDETVPLGPDGRPVLPPEAPAPS